MTVGATPSRSGVDGPARRVLDAMAETLDTITGTRPKEGRIAPLPTNATTAEIIAKINEFLAKWQV